MGMIGSLECSFEKILFLPQETDLISHLKLFSKCTISLGFLLIRIIDPCSNGVL